MLREIISNEWFTILIVLSLCILAFAKFYFSKRFNDYLSLIGNSKYLKIYAKEQKFIDKFDALLFGNLMLSLTIFSFISYNVFIEQRAFDINSFLKVILVISILILSKILFERLIGSLFEIDTLIDAYLFQKTNYKNYIGLILLPINIILIFTIKPSTSILYFVVGFIFLINLIGFLTSFKAYQKLILNNLFYFILYLCALEIAPYVIFYKVFISN